MADAAMYGMMDVDNGLTFKTLKGWRTSIINPDVPSEQTMHKSKTSATKPDLFDQLTTLANTPDALQYIRDQTTEHIDFALSKDPHTVRWINRLTPELLLRAVDRDPTVIKHFHHLRGMAESRIPYKAYRRVLELNGLLLSYVKEQDATLCMTAVTENGLALQFVRRQTEAICETAVAQNPRAIMYAHYRTPKMREIVAQAEATAASRPQRAAGEPVIDMPIDWHID